ncbi:YfcC family protein [Natronoflexus pectinivorans]|uniref:Putative ion transporter superfamily protein YfcC n=1 Tax=Natronoflexus pectinivorans TaxID=682526 RepID=A0A4R2GMG4_9BACT|nr:AbgT family transporter [Natronoflexus pectinivorans]TCO09908.1 putative ion transporter superfamily protein YfcC [Natronoflexus pectinivorans]
MLRKVPHTYVIVFSLILISAVATWFVPGGEYVPFVDEHGVVQEGMLVFESIDNQPQTWEVFAAMFQGFERQAGIIVFILMIGGAFWILNESRAIDVGIRSFLKFTSQLDKYRIMRWLGTGNIIIVFIMLMFSVFGAVFGMSEETIAFIIILVPLAISLGYDSLTGVGMVFVAAGLGFAGAVLNPFTIGIAQGLAGLPLFSGFEYRLFCWVVINIVGISFILWHANRVKRRPENSPVYEEDEYWREHIHINDVDNDKPVTYKSSWITWGITLMTLILFSFSHPETTLVIGGGSGFTWYFIPLITLLFAVTGYLSLKVSSPVFVLNLLAYTIVFLIVGVMGYHWYIMEIAALFFAMGILSGLAMNKTADQITNLFLDGARDIMAAALIVGLAGGIIVILEEGRIIHTILHAMAGGMSDLGDVASVGVMYVIQTVINVVIPSGSAKAALTMPIMAPFSDLIGLSRQATVMAFQFGDGFTNMITPTSGVLIGVLGVAKIPYVKWAKWIAPLIIILGILGFLLLIPTVTMDLNGF